MFSNIKEKNLVDWHFLNSEFKMKDKFFVIDNTDYPEALNKQDWKGFERPKDDSMDVVMSTSIQTTFESNRKYQMYVSSFASILFTLIMILIIVVSYYCYAKYKYNKYVQERKKLKHQLIKV